ncbi:hypothetical protein tinsulaeT_38170 [Thalassotalea insulae]|uniref:Membrane protein YesL n=1 Tax=Thalassotalea insulae TaxID=2056778 RepID=A0ABQ6H0Y2_9GAMM|nr:hypothetical protein [Thalassotalea insulae]GLX80477.1 hypothetical protein tinsulaeT_38170 [Thalassotalea insulae]
MEERSILQVGGSIEKALKGEYSIDVKGVLHEAWRLTNKSRSSINLGLFISLLIGVLVTLLVASYVGGVDVLFQEQQGQQEPQAGALLNILVTIVVYPFLVGVEMMGIFHAVGLQTHVKLIFAFLKRGSWVAICALLSSTMVALGVTMFYLPGIYLAVALSLVLPLVVEKKMSPLKAISLSLQVTRFQWFHLFAIYLVLFIALILCVLPLVLLATTSVALLGGVFTLFALSYLAPMFYNVKGILYREIFGMHLSVSKDASDHFDSTFSA